MFDHHALLMQFAVHQCSLPTIVSHSTLSSKNRGLNPLQVKILLEALSVRVCTIEPETIAETWPGAYCVQLAGPGPGGPACRFNAQRPVMHRLYQSAKTYQCFSTNGLRCCCCFFGDAVDSRVPSVCLRSLRTLQNDRAKNRIRLKRIHRQTQDQIPSIWSSTNHRLNCVEGYRLAQLSQFSCCRHKHSALL
jgi:hypothetical protein